MMAVYVPTNHLYLGDIVVVPRERAIFPGPDRRRRHSDFSDRRHVAARSAAAAAATRRQRRTSIAAAWPRIWARDGRAGSSSVSDETRVVSWCDGSRCARVADRAGRRGRRWRSGAGAAREPRPGASRASRRTAQAAKPTSCCPIWAPVDCRRLRRPHAAAHRPGRLRARPALRAGHPTTS